MNNSVILCPDNLTANVCGISLSAETPTELYVNVIETLLKNYPSIIGLKETHFTSDKSRAELYTGTTRKFQLNGSCVYIKTGFSTKDKWKGIEKTCQLAGIIMQLKPDGAIDKPKDSIANQSFVKNAAMNRIADARSSIKESLAADQGCTYIKPTLDGANIGVKAMDKSLNFAFHSEYYIGFDRSYSLLSSTACDYNGSCYIRYDKGFYNDYGSYISVNGICKIDSDAKISLIRSDNDNFNGNFAVNHNGIFVLNGNRITLFDEDGKKKASITICKSDAIYIYDNKVYAIDLQHAVYEYDIYDKKSKRLLWMFKEHRSEIKELLIDELVSKGIDFKTLQKGITVIDIKNIGVYANDSYVICGFSFLNEKYYNRPEVYFCYDLIKNTWNYIHVASPDATVKIFSFDMKNSRIWWYKENQGNKYLFSTSIRKYEKSLCNVLRYQYVFPYIETNGCSKCALYFDGEKMYYSTANCFYAIWNNGSYNLWKRSEYSGGIDFRVVDKYVYSDRIEDYYLTDDVKLFPATYKYPCGTELLVYKKEDIAKLL